MTPRITRAAIGLIALAAAAPMAYSDGAERSPLFVSGHVLLGSQVGNRTDKSAAQIADLVVSYDGRVAYALIDTGGMLGVGERRVAVPYAALSWDRANNRYMIDATAEQLRALSQFDSQDLASLDRAEHLASMQRVFGRRSEFDRPAEHRNHDEYSPAFGKDRVQSIKGEIAGVNRSVSTARGREYYAVIIQTGENDQTMRTVLLAPRAWLEAQKNMPREGQDVSARTVEAYDAGGDRVLVAQTIEFDGHDLRLRSDHGAVEWKIPADEDRKGAAPYVLASDLDDGNVIAAREPFGDVKDVVYEVNSGSAAYVLVSVGGLLSIGDTLYPIPFESLSPGGDADFHTDRSVAQLKMAPKLSDQGVKDLNSDDFSRTIHDFFKIEPRPYDTDRAVKWSADGQAAASAR